MITPKVLLTAWLLFLLPALSSGAGTGSCVGLCGQQFGSITDCYCDPICDTFGDCCSDYYLKCNIAPTSSAAPSTTFAPSNAPSVSTAPSISPSFAPSNAPSVSAAPSIFPSSSPSIHIGTCVGFCGQEFGSIPTCFCDSLCEPFGDCCSDYFKCNTEAPSSVPTVVPTSSAAPSTSFAPSNAPTVSAPPSTANSNSPTINTVSYRLYTTGGCDGRDELGTLDDVTVRECANACTGVAECVSFEFLASGVDSLCQLSSSCSEFSMTVQDPNNAYDWYLRLD